MAARTGWKCNHSEGKATEGGTDSAAEPPGKGTNPWSASGGPGTQEFRDAPACLPPAGSYQGSAFLEATDALPQGCG